MSRAVALAPVDDVLNRLRRRKLTLIEKRAHLAYQRSRPVWARRVLEGGPGAYAAFVRWAWHIIEPGTLLRWNWHMDKVCAAIQRQIEGDPDYRRLLIILPPGTAKSIILSACRDPYMWLTEAHRRTVYASADDGLASRDSRRARNIIKSADYQHLMQRVATKRGLAVWGLANDQNEKSDFENTQRGFRLCVGMDSNITGSRGDDLIIDDALDAKKALRGSDATIERRMEEVNTTIGAVLKSRVNNQDKATITIMGQRLHPADHLGMAIAKGGWKVIVFPMEYDPDLPKECGGPCVEDIRTERGEVLHRGMFSDQAIAELKEDPPSGLGLAQFNGQYNATPTRKTSKRLRPEWFSVRYSEPPERMRGELDHVFAVVDGTFKATGASNVCVQVWGKRDTRRYLLYEVARPMGYVETRQVIKDVVAAWELSTVVIEDKANGPALLDDLREHLPDVQLVPFDPGTPSKEEREQVFSVPAFAASNVLLPMVEYAPWLVGYLAEMRGETSKNDRRDCTSMAMAWSQGIHKVSRGSIAALLDDW